MTIIEQKLTMIFETCRHQEIHNPAYIDTNYRWNYIESSHQN